MPPTPRSPHPFRDLCIVPLETSKLLDAKRVASRTVLGMRALLTGASGTVGQTLGFRLRELGNDVVPDRGVVPIDRYEAMDRMLRRLRLTSSTILRLPRA